MRCPRCDADYPDGVDFCPKDGSRLHTAQVSSSTDPFVGKVLDGRFRVLERIGRGGMGSVYRARQLNVDRDVAVKVLTGDAADDPEVARRFETEAKVISQLRSPYTLTLFDFGRLPDGRLYLVTQLLEGAPLDVVLMESGALAIDRTLRILSQVAGSLTEAHGMGVVHRDLKPGNIFLERVGGREVARVLDFGIAKLASNSVATRTGTVFGTPAYMSPEQARGEHVDARSDLYSLGVVAYECLAGKPPFQGSTPYSVLIKHMQEIPVPLRELAPPIGLDSAIDNLVLWLLEKMPDDRPPSAEHLRTTLEELPRTTDAPAPLPPPVFAPRSAPAPEAPTPAPEAPSQAPSPLSSGPSLSASTMEAIAPPRSRGRWLFISALTLVVIGLGGWLAVRETPALPAKAPAASPDPRDAASAAIPSTSAQDARPPLDLGAPMDAAIRDASPDAERAPEPRVPTPPARRSPPRRRRTARRARPAPAPPPVPPAPPPERRRRRRPPPGLW